MLRRRLGRREMAAFCAKLPPSRIGLEACGAAHLSRPGPPNCWRPRKLAAVALANKMARIVWAMIVSGELYRRPQPGLTDRL